MTADAMTIPKDNQCCGGAEVAEEIQHSHVDNEAIGAEEPGNGSCRHARYRINEEAQHEVFQ